MTWKKTITIIVITVILLVIGFFGLYLGSGNYGYAQRYEYNLSKKNLIKATEDLIIRNPQYKVPASLDLTNSLDSTSGYYHGYIYYPLENKTVHFIILSAPDNLNKSFIYLDAVNEGQYLGHWKVVNQDYDREENLRVKELFVEKFLDKLKFPFKDNGNGMFIFWK